VTKLNRISFAPARSPWSWAIVPLVAVAAVGQWAGRTAAELVAAGCGAVGVGIVIGLTIAGRHGVAPQGPKPPTSAKASHEPPTGESSGRPSAETGSKVPPSNLCRTVDLRGARLTNAKLVRADLRQADLRGALLMEADLTDADLTDARLGPLRDEPHDHKPS
jgi:hypothetical protein